MNRRKFLQTCFTILAGGIYVLRNPAQITNFIAWVEHFTHPWYCPCKYCGNMVMGYKGSTLFEAGYIYCPYIPLQRIVS